MAFRLKLAPDETHIRFVRYRNIGYALSAIVIVASIALFFTRGLNYGIDFVGGIMVEIGTETPADIGAIRAGLGNLDLGDVAVQEFGANNDVLIRVERQPGDDDAQNVAIARIKEKLVDVIGADVSFRRIEVVGPKVSDELFTGGMTAIGLAILAILIYIWFRFEWQFGVGTVAALVHDVAATIGFFSITGLEFNLSIVAALLTIIGYSLNDTVVIFDRVRENLRKYRKLELGSLIDQSVNETLSRTLMTSFTTLVALVALFAFGGAVIRGFTAAMIWGIFIGTYSTVYVASPLLMVLGVKREHLSNDEDS